VSLVRRERLAALRMDHTCGKLTIHELCPSRARICIPMNFFALYGVPSEQSLFTNVSGATGATLRLENEALVRKLTAHKLSLSCSHICIPKDLFTIPGVTTRIERSLSVSLVRRERLAALRMKRI
jgi:hypothetical protein